MGVEVDEAGCDNAAGGVDLILVGGGLQRRGDVDDDAALDADIDAAAAALVDHRAAGDQHRAHASLSRSRPLPRSSNSTAIRTAMPFVTCCVITEPGSSDGSTAISTPRFIGPGCMISAWSGSAPARSGVSPKRLVYSRRLGTNDSVIRSCCIRSRYSTSSSPITASRS